MTSNQINYWTLQEHARANRANEGLKQSELDEKHRSNVRNELIKLLDYVDNPYALGIYLATNGLDITTPVDVLNKVPNSIFGNNTSYSPSKFNIFGSKIDNSYATRGISKKLSDAIFNGVQYT